MNLKQIESFIRVAELQSFTKAAHQLFMSQPAVSFQIKALEEDLSVVLFKRGDKKMILTDAGQLLYREAKQMFNHYQKIKTGLDDLKGLKTGHLTVGAGTTPGEYILPLLIGDFSKVYPDVKIYLKVAGSGEIVRWVRNREIDLGFTGVFVEGQDVECSPWLKDELLLIVPPFHNWTEIESIKAADLKNEYFIFREKGSGTRRTVEEKLSKRIAVEQIPKGLELGSTRAVITAVEAGFGVSVVSRCAAKEALELGRVKMVRIDDLDLCRSLYHIQHKQSMDGFVVKAFMEYIENDYICDKYNLIKIKTP